MKCHNHRTTADLYAMLNKNALLMISCAAAVVTMMACGGGDNPIVVPSNNGLAADEPAEFAAPAASLTQYQLHLNNATANAGKEEFFATTLRTQWCFSAENTGMPPELFNLAVVPATKIFDDVYFMGPRWVGQYAFKTSQGVFLLDTLNNTTEARTITEPELLSVGINPSTIIAALGAHGHGDHYGGAGYLQATYRTPVYLGSADKGVGANPTARPGQEVPLPFIVTPISSENLLPQPLSVGDLNMTLLSTPGHTPGTISGIMPVKHKGVAYKVAFWGGTAMPNTIAPARQYLDGAERIWRLSREQGISGTIHTHPFVDGSLSHIDNIRANGLGDQNPFLVGKDKALRSLSILRSCAAAKVAQLDTTAILPEWRFSTVTTAATWIKGGSSNLSASARVKSPYGVVTAGSVTFSFAPGGETCTATVNDSGIATCTVTSTGSTQQSVTATYAGSDSSTVANLPAAATTSVQALN